jgi:hypothetical protein
MLIVRWMYHRPDPQACHINQNMPLPAADLLPCVVALWINPGSPTQRFVRVARHWRLRSDWLLARV